jgi:hypothetical protein
MGNIKKVFRGKGDPNKISLEKVFPDGDLVFSTPFGVEQGKHHRIIVEGNSAFLEKFDDYTDILLKSVNDFGRWVALTNYILEEPSLELIYEPKSAKEVLNLLLLVFILRVDLVKICNLRLSPVSVINATIDHVTVLYKPIPLPENLGNGFLDLMPSIIIPSPQKVN